MKKLVLFTVNYPFGVGEASFVNPELSLLCDFFEVTIVAKNIKDIQTSIVPSSVKVVRVDSKTKLSLRNISRILFSKVFWIEIIKNPRCFADVLHQALSAEQFFSNIKQNELVGNDYLYYSYWYDQSITGLVFHKKEITGSKIVTRIHRADLYGTHFFRKQFDSSIDKIVFISNEGREYYLKHNDIVFKPDKHVLHYLGVSKTGERNHLDTGKEIKLMSCSYLSPVKRVNKIIDVISEITGYDVNWTHIGDGTLHDNIIEYAKQKLGAKGNVKYSFLGSQSNEFVHDFLHNNPIDLFINLSESEGLPVSFMEAMSEGIPVITNCVGGVSEIVNEQNGIIVGVNDSPKTIADAVCAYKSLESNRVEAMRENAFQTWKKRFEAENNYNRFLDMLLTLQ